MLAPSCIGPDGHPARKPNAAPRVGMRRRRLHGRRAACGAGVHKERHGPGLDIGPTRG